MTLELIFGLVQAVITAVLGTFTKKGKIPKKYIPIQNILVGIVSSLIAIHFDIYTDYGIAIFTCLAISLGVGGGYDAFKIKDK